MKFGGSSVATAERMRQIGEILLTLDIKNEQVILVVSALRNITDQLLECASLAANNQEDYKKIFKYISERHLELLSNLVEEKNNPLAYGSVKKILHELYKTLHSIQYLRDNDLYILDLVASFGEQLSATILAAYLNSLFPARFVDARQFIITNNHFTNARVLYEESSHAIQNYFDQFFKQEEEYTVPIVTGFIGMTKDKHATTLGRDGSNYTLAVLGAALNARVIEIWSDVDGVYSADPKLIPSSVVQPTLSYIEAEELSNFRVKVIRSAIIPQLIEKNIPMYVKNTFNPTAVGTYISLHAKSSAIKNVSVMHGLVLITLSTLFPIEISISHIIERLFRVLPSAGIHLTLITQTSSTHDVCFSIHETEAKRVQELINIEFLHEFQQNFLMIKKSANQSLIVLIGNNIKQLLSNLGKIFIDLDHHHIRLNGIAHGTSECNMSFVINSNQSHKALEVIHHSIFQNPS